MTQTVLHISTYALAALALVSLWIFPKAVGGVLYAAAVVLGLMNHAIGAFGLAWIFLLGILTASYFGWIPFNSRTGRASIGVVIVLISWGLMRHFLPGFENWKVYSSLSLDRSSPSFPLYLNFDSPTVAFLLLAIGLPILRGKAAWLNLFAWLPVYVAIAAALIAPAAYWLEWARWNPKWPSVAALWVGQNFLFTVLPEEALFRGFIQRELESAWAHRRLGSWWALLAASLLFGLLHTGGGAAAVFLWSLAGLAYGLAYRRRGRVEDAIAVHLVVNLLHFFLFSYPKLK